MALEAFGAAEQMQWCCSKWTYRDGSMVLQQVEAAGQMQWRSGAAAGGIIRAYAVTVVNSVAGEATEMIQ